MHYPGSRFGSTCSTASSTTMTELDLQSHQEHTGTPTASSFPGTRFLPGYCGRVHVSVSRYIDRPVSSLPRVPGYQRGRFYLSANGSVVTSVFVVRVLLKQIFLREIEIRSHAIF
eukprot:475368-Rhodomonas_salina.1